MIRKFAQLFDEPPPQEPPDNQICHHSTCEKLGTYRARQSPEQQHLWVWFCLEHVREHHAKWDFYAARTDEEIDQDRTQDYGWNRPTWPLGVGPREYTIRDPFGFFTEDTAQNAHAGFFERSATSSGTFFVNGLPPELEKALQLFDIGLPFTPESLKKRFRQLVKKYHPDHQNFAATSYSEDMIRQVNGAYTLLKNYATCAE